MEEEEPCPDDVFVQRLTASQAELRSLVLGFTPTRADADDVLQEVNLALWKKRASYEPSRRFSSWACGFVLMEVRRHRKKSARSRLWFGDQAMEAIAKSWAERTSSDDLRLEALGGCLKKLGAEERQCLALYYGGQKSGPDIAEQMGKPLSTVYKILARARRLLRGCIDRTLGKARHSCATLLLLVSLLYG